MSDQAGIYTNGLKTMHTLARIRIIARSLFRLLLLSRQEVEDYVKSNDFFAHDFTSEKQMRDTLGADYIRIYQKSQLDSYYVLNDISALGLQQRLYSPPLIDENKSVLDNYLLFEKRMVGDLKPVLKPHSKVLDLGCGLGVVSINVHKQTGNSVTGINIDPAQAEYARKMVKNRYPNEFILGDFNDPRTFDHLDEKSFDAAYQIQSLSTVHDKMKFFKQINRLLGPGARYAILCYVRTPHYDRENPTHYDLMVRTKQLMLAIYSPLATEYHEWLENSGFKIVLSEDLSVKGELSSVILYEKLYVHYMAVERWIRRLSRCRLLPQHMATIFAKLNKEGDAWYELDRLKLVSPTYYIVAEKVRDV